MQSSGRTMPSQGILFYSRDYGDTNGKSKKNETKISVDRWLQSLSIHVIYSYGVWNSSSIVPLEAYASALNICLNIRLRFLFRSFHSLSVNHVMSQPCLLNPYPCLYPFPFLTVPWLCIRLLNALIFMHPKRKNKNKHAALLDQAARIPISLLHMHIDTVPNQTKTAPAATICTPTTTTKSMSIAALPDLASFWGTADGNANPFEFVPSAACAVGPLVAVMRNPLSSYDGTADIAAGSMVTKTGNPFSSHLVTTSRPEATDEIEPGEEGDCAGVGWGSDCTKDLCQYLWR